MSRSKGESVASETRAAALPGPIGFNAQHPAMGAFMSFTCGCPGAAGGLGVEIGRPASQNVFVGIRRGPMGGGEPIRCLPFYRDAQAEASAASSYDVENPNAAGSMRGIEAIDLTAVTRRYGWASDTWEAPGLSFRLDTPFGTIPEPGPAGAGVAAMRRALLPAVTGALEIDNRRGGGPVTGVFALDFVDPGARVLWDHGGARGAAFAWRRHLGAAARVEGGGAGERPRLFQRWAVADGLENPAPVHALGTCAGFAVEVPAGERRTLVLALGVHLDGVVTTGLEGRYLYTRYFAGLEDVLDAALASARARRRAAAALDAELAASGLTADQRFQLAHATRGYYGSTQLLEVGGEPLWVVNEGEYCMMNTLDLSVDQGFWELRHNPWVVRNVLDRFADRYRYHDRVHRPGGGPEPGGVSFTHDMGAHNHFSRPGHSSYELPRLTGCFSYMTQEQLCNWVLLGGCYAAATGGDAWLAGRRDLLTACARSMAHRADPDTGVMARDSSRCEGGSEITTYDSLDESLGQARASTALAVKCWAAWLALEMLGAARGPGDAGVKAPADDAALREAPASLADTIADHLASSVRPDGTLPAVLEPDSPGYDARVLPVVEALVYPAYWSRRLAQREAQPGARRRLAEAMRHPMIGVLAEHARRLLHDPEGRNTFGDGGLRLSSTSGNSWMSKIALCQHAVRSVLRLTEGDPALSKLLARADAAHTVWQTQGSAYWASSDQIIHGIAKGSRYYPRLVTAVLWLDEHGADPGTPRPAEGRDADAASPTLTLET